MPSRRLPRVFGMVASTRYDPYSTVQCSPRHAACLAQSRQQSCALWGARRRSSHQVSPLARELALRVVAADQTSAGMFTLPSGDLMSCTPDRGEPRPAARAPPVPNDVSDLSPRMGWMVRHHVGSSFFFFFCSSLIDGVQRRANSVLPSHHPTRGRRAPSAAGLSSGCAHHRTCPRAVWPGVCARALAIAREPYRATPRPGQRRMAVVAIFGERAPRLGAQDGAALRSEMSDHAEPQPVVGGLPATGGNRRRSHAAMAPWHGHDELHSRHRTHDVLRLCAGLNSVLLLPYDGDRVARLRPDDR